MSDISQKILNKDLEAKLQQSIKDLIKQSGE